MSGDSNQTGSGSFGRLLAASFAVALLPALILADSIQAWQRGWRPENTLDRGLVALAMLTLIGVVFAVLLPPSRRWLASRCAQLWLAVASIVLALFICEWTVRTWLPAAPLHTREPGYHQTFTPDANVLKGLSPTSTYTISSLGLRGEEPKDSAKGILCLGGSTTECVYLDDQKTWPQQFMLAMSSASPDKSFWVANAGQGSLATGHHRQFLKQSPLTAQFDIVVMLVGLNDLLRELRGLPTGNAAPQWFARLASLELVQRVWNGYLGMGLVADAPGTKLTLLRRLQPHTQDYVAPELTEALEAYRRRLVELISTCERKNIQPVFVTQPVTGSVKLRRRLDLAEARNVDLLAEMIGRYNRVLIDVCNEHDVQEVDLSSMNGVDEYFCDHYNFSEAGAAELARILAESLSQRLQVGSEAAGH